MSVYSFNQTDLTTRDAKAAFDTGQTPIDGSASGCASGATFGATNGAFSSGGTGLGIMWESTDAVHSFTSITSLVVPFDFTNFGSSSSGTLTDLWFLYITSGGAGHTIAHYGSLGISMTSHGIKNISVSGAPTSGPGSYTANAGDEWAFILQFNSWGGGYWANDQTIILTVDGTGISLPRGIVVSGDRPDQSLLPIDGKVFLPLYGPPTGVIPPAPESYNPRVYYPPDERWMGDPLLNGAKTLLGGIIPQGRVGRQTVPQVICLAENTLSISAPNPLLVGGKPVGAVTPPSRRPVLSAAQDGRSSVDDYISLHRGGDVVMQGGKPYGPVEPIIHRPILVAIMDDVITLSTQQKPLSQLYGGVANSSVTPPFHRPPIIVLAEDIHSRLRIQESIVNYGPIFKLPPGSPPVAFYKQDDSYLVFPDPFGQVKGGKPFLAVTPPIPQSVIVSKGPDGSDIDAVSREPGKVLATISRLAGVLAPTIITASAHSDHVTSFIPLTTTNKGGPVNIQQAPNVRVSSPPLPDILDIAQPYSVAPILKSGLPYIPVKIVKPVGEEQLLTQDGARQFVPVSFISLSTPPKGIQVVNPNIEIDQAGASSIMVCIQGVYIATHPPTYLEPDSYIRSITILGSAGG